MDDTSPSDENVSLECKFCAKRFTNPGIYSQHRNGVHFQRSLYDCQVCEKTFLSEFEVSRHMRATHDEDKIASCDRANSEAGIKAMKTLEAMRTEVKSEPLPDQSESPRPGLTTHSHPRVFRPAILSRSMYNCQLCLEDFTSSDELLLHLDLHLDPKAKPVDWGQKESELERTCSICLQVFDNTTWLRIHKKYHHRGQSGEEQKPTMAQQFIRSGVSCSACSAAFLKLDEYYNHLLENHSTLELHKVN